MKLRNTLPSALLALLALTSFILDVTAARQPSNSVLLRKVATLTLKKDKQTSHRRVSALPQLKCIGGSGKDLYEIDVMRCENSGAAYDADDVEWTCKANLPPEFKLGSTEVICEGYNSPDDPYILKGSCGVEYRLILTEQGEEKYGKKSWWDKGSEDSYGPTKTDKFVSSVFWLLFFGVLVWMVYSFFTSTAANGGANPGPRRPGGWGGWGGGGGGNDDPPPPYDYHPPPRKSYSTYTTQPAAQEGWRPGFWSGAAGGAAAAYALGQRSQRDQRPQGGGGSWFGGGGNGEGPSRSQGSSAPSTARYESTGFGSTRRR